MHVPSKINTLREGNSKNSLELNAGQGAYDQSRVRPALLDPNDKANRYILLKKRSKMEAKRLFPS